MTTAAFASLVVLPTVITGPGTYETRIGEQVEVKTQSSRHDFGCKGQYPNGVNEGWHKSGRLYFGMLTENDIVKRLQ